MKFSGRMCLKIILKFTKHQDFSLSLKDTFFKKITEEGGGGQFHTPPPPQAFSGLTSFEQN